MKFGRLTALRRGENGPRRETQWYCVCECDPSREVLMQASGMVAGRTKSCGCFAREVAGDARRRHGMSNTSTYHSWSSAKNRCTNRLNGKWSYYGGRGITMCRRWRDDFAAFLADMGEAPTGHSVDRIDTNGHYSCGKCDDCATRGLGPNCRWATRSEQARNMRSNVVVVVNGESATLAEWSERTGTNYAAMRGRIKAGVAPSVVIDPASHHIERVIVGPDGTARRLAEWARVSGVAASTILWRIDNGWSPALAASTPRTHRFRPATQKQ